MDVLRGHAKGVMAVDFSPDGKLLATASGEHTVKIWDPSTRELRRTLTSITNEVQSVAFSPDGKYLAAGCLEHGAKLWEAGTWQEVTNLTCVDTWGGVSRLRFSLDGKFLVTGTGGLAQVWEAGSWRALTNLIGDARTGVAFSRDSRLLATGGELVPTVQLLEVGTWKPIKSLAGHNKGISALTFTPDGHTLVTGSDDSTIRIWDVSSGQKKAPLKGHAGSVRAMAVSPDGKTLASSDVSGAIKLWNLATGKELFTLVGHDASVLSLAFSPDGMSLASGSSDTTVRLWRTSIPESSNAAAERNR
jgi:WD40 repeat protein